MKKSTLFFILLLEVSGLNAQTLYEVGTGKTYETISSAWNAIKDDSGTDFLITVDEGTYIESEMYGNADKKITISGAGADKTIVKRSNSETFSIMSTENPGYLFRTQAMKGAADSLELTCRNMSFQTMGQAQGNAGGALVVSDEPGQKFTFKNCNFKNIICRQGPIIACNTSEDPVTFTMENCFVEECGIYDFNQIAGLMYFKYGGNITLKDVAFMNNTSYNYNFGTNNTGADRNLKSGQIVYVQTPQSAYPTNILMENCYIVDHSIDADATSMCPMIRISATASDQIASVEFRNVVSVGNIRTGTPDCDFYFPNGIMTPLMNSSYFNSMLNQTGNKLIPSYTGATIDDALTFTYPEINFVMDGSSPKIFVDEYGVQYLKTNPVTTGMSSAENAGLEVVVENGILRIAGKDITGVVSVFDVSGKMIASREVVDSSTSFLLAKGIYIVKVRTRKFKVVV